MAGSPLAPASVVGNHGLHRSGPAHDLRQRAWLVVAGAGPHPGQVRRDRGREHPGRHEVPLGREGGNVRTADHRVEDSAASYAKAGAVETKRGRGDAEQPRRWEGLEDRAPLACDRVVRFVDDDQLRRISDLAEPAGQRLD